MSMRSICLLLSALGAGCVLDPGLTVPDFSVPKGGTDLAPAGDLSHPDGGGAIWSMGKYGTANLRAVWAADAALATVYIVGSDGTILRRAPGADFAPETSGTTENLYAVLGVSADEVYVAGDHGTILHRKNGTWAKEAGDLHLTVGLFGLAMPAAGDVYAVGDGGTIIHFTGGMWVKETTNTMANLRAALATSPQEVFAVGAEGTVLHRAMNAWAADTATVPGGATKPNLLALALLDTTLFAAGEYGVVLQRTMAAWTTEATVKPPMMGQPAHLFGLWGGGGVLYAVGATGEVQRRAAGTWTEEKSGTAEDLSGVTGSAQGAILAVGNKGTVVRRQ